MKKVILSALAIGSLTSYAGAAAQAAQNDDVLARIEALEKKVAALSEEKNAALRENQVLRQQNAVLKPATRPQATTMHSAAAPTASRPDPLRAYASAPPMAYKGPVAETRGQLRIWGEGGATWTGGDPNPAFYSKQDFAQSLGPLGGTGIPVGMNVRPSLGYEGAAGFDYRFAESPWHVSGQFRYGEGRGNTGASSAGNVDAATIAAINASIGPLGINGGAPLAFLAGAGGNQTFSASGKETHWLADLAFGRDVLGSGASAMQLKFGLRLAELQAGVNSTDRENAFINFTGPVLIYGPAITSIGASTLNTVDQTSRFFGAGPRIGVDGSVPFAGKWAFDYAGDAAVLFGTQRFSQTATSAVTSNIAIFGGGGTTSAANTDERSATVFNADLQAGFSYWVTPSVKVSASYRVDAFFNVMTALSALNDPTKLQRVDRYYHGPRIGLTGQF